MMTFLGNVVWFFMAATAIIIFACVGIVGLAVLDYALDSDIKGALVRTLGPRHWLRRIRINLLKVTKKIDTPSEKELMDITDNTKEILYRNPDYDAEIHKLLEEIEKDVYRKE